MGWLHLGLTQVCTYWEVTGSDGYNNPTFAAPRQLPCRWEDRIEKIQNDEGREVISRSRLFLMDDVTPGSYIAFGTVPMSNPIDLPNAHAIAAFRRTPSLDGLEWERKCYL